MIITAINNNDNDNNDDDDDDDNNNNNNNNSKVFSLINVICRVIHMDNFSLCYKLVNLSSIPVVFALSCMCFFTVCKVMEKKEDQLCSLCCSTCNYCLGPPFFV